MSGDFNARHPRWGDSHANYHGLVLDNWLTKNDFKYKAALAGSSGATFPQANSFLDFCLYDIRLTIVNAKNGKIPTLPYDSDHNCLKMKFFIPNKDAFPLYEEQEKNTTNFNNTDWAKFNT